MLKDSNNKISKSKDEGLRVSLEDNANTNAIKGSSENTNTNTISAKELLANRRREWLIKARAKRKELSEGGALKRKGTKFREELESQARQTFLNKIIPALKQLSRIELNYAKKPDNVRSRQYLIDQVIGKATELTKLNLNRGNIKELENDMRQWAKKPSAELEIAIKKLPEVKEEAD